MGKTTTEADLIAWAVLLVALLLLAGVATNGCGQQADSVGVHYVRGGGAVGVDVKGHTVELAFREVHEEGTSCAVVDVFAIDGVRLGSGFLPMMSDPGCAELFAPFGRPAPELVNADPEPEPLPPLSGP